MDRFGNEAVVSTEFLSAVQQLVRAHAREVDEFRRRLASFDALGSFRGNSSARASGRRVSWGSNLASLSFGEDCISCIAKPLESPRMNPSHPHGGTRLVSTCASSEVMTPRKVCATQASLETSKAAMSSFENPSAIQKLARPQMEDVKVVSLYQPSDAPLPPLHPFSEFPPVSPRTPCEDTAFHEAVDLTNTTPNYVHLLSSSSHRNSSCLTSESSLSALNTILATSHPSECSTTLFRTAFLLDETEVSEDVKKRWVTLTSGVLLFRSNVRYVVHPDWIDVESSNSLRTSSLPISSIALRTNNMAEVQQMIDPHQAAYAQQEKSALTKGSVGGNKILKTRARTLARIPTVRSQSGSYDFVLHPDSLIRRAWVLVCCIVFMYEIFAVTMAPFDILEGEIGNSLEYCSAVFWSGDICMNFISGIYVKGTLELRFHVVAKAYAKTWLAFDIIVVACQWCGLLVKSLSNKINATILLRLVRVIRSFRLGRIMYWLRDEFGLSRSTLSRGKLVHVMIILYFFTHTFACLLYAIGKTKDGWVSEYNFKLKDESSDYAAFHNYLVCLHWALSQLQGNVDLYPTTTTGNLLFVVVSSSCSIVALTLFVSSATDTLQDVRQQQQHQLDEERLLREFFRRNDIHPEIKHRADYYLNLKKKQRRILECKDNDEEALMMFPKQLRHQLLTEMRSESILWHPLFAYLQRQARGIFVRVCAGVLHLQSYEPNDDVFVVDEASSSAHIISRGEFVITSSAELMPFAVGSSWAQGQSFGSSKSLLGSCRSPNGQRRNAGTPSSSAKGSNIGVRNTAESLDYAIKISDDMKRPVRNVVVGQLVSEISLWMPWVHVGDLCSKEHGHCFEMSAKELIAAIKSQGSPFAVFGTYACRFVDAAKQMKQSLLEIELMGFSQVVEIEARENDAGESSPVSRSLWEHSRLSQRGI